MGIQRHGPPAGYPRFDDQSGLLLRDQGLHPHHILRQLNQGKAHPRLGKGIPHRPAHL
ncbi:MAG: hypothetical protein ACK559_33870 [bacterium]